jgi:hypothetical protein
MSEKVPDKSPHEEYLKASKQLEALKKSHDVPGAAIPTLWFGFTCGEYKKETNQPDCMPGWTMAGTYTSETDAAGE